MNERPPRQAFFRRTLVMSLCAGWALAGEVLPERVPLTYVERAEENSRINYSSLYLSVKDGRANMGYPSPSGYVALEHRSPGWLVDRNLDGKLNDQDLPLVGSLGTFSLPAVHAGKAVACYFRLRQDGDESLSLTVLSRLEGAVGTYRFSLAENTYSFNGRFNDTGQDSLVIQPQDASSVTKLSWHPVITFAHRLWNCSLIEDGGVLHFTPYTGPTARLTIALDPASPGPQSPSITHGNVELTHHDQSASISIGLLRPPAVGSGITTPGLQDATGRMTLLLPRTWTSADGKTHGPDLYLEAVFPEHFTLPAGDTRLVYGIPNRLSSGVCMPEPGLILVEDATLWDAQGNGWKARSAGSDGSEIAFFITTGGTETKVGSMEYG